MFFARRRKSEHQSRASIASARAHLVRVLQDCERSIGCLSKNFQSLATDCEELTRTTQDLVHAAQSSCVEDVLPFMQRVYGDCEQVLRLRLEAAQGVSELLVREVELLEELERPSRAQRSTSRTARIVAVMLRIEIARLGSDGNGFSYMSGELEQASHRISQGVDVLEDVIRERTGGVPARRIRIDDARARVRSHLAVLEGGREEALARADRALSDFQRLPSTLDACVHQAQADIASVTSAVQMQDLTRQQTEHIGGVLGELLADGGCSTYTEAQIPLVLEVQRAQIENVKRTTEDWLEEIERCVASILRLGDVELLAIMHQIVGLQNSLEEQGRWVAQFEKEFEAHDRISEQELEEFEAMMELVRRHLEQSQKTSEHLQLLNLNSMVAAHNVGAQAASVLQITNSISRLATDWRALTMRSADSMVSMLSEATSRGKEARDAAERTRAALARIREESESTLEAVRSIAGLGVRQQSAGHEIVRRMQDRVTYVHQSMQELRAVIDAIATASADMARALEEMGGADPLAFTEKERAAVERVCQSAYTSETERQVLRCVLFGEQMSPPSLECIEGAIELFWMSEAETPIQAQGKDLGDETNSSGGRFIERARDDQLHLEEGGI